MCGGLDMAGEEGRGEAGEREEGEPKVEGGGDLKALPGQGGGTEDEEEAPLDKVAEGGVGGW